MHPTKTIDILRAKTDEVILFHSGTGKDSIALLNMISPVFTRVVCVFMYMVKGLTYENKYIEWAQKNYKNIEFYQTPHFSLASFIKHGHLGIKKNESVEANSIHKVDTLVKIKYNINWSIYGFKKCDGITRRLMLNGYQNNMYERTHKAYPLADWSNNDVYKYIADNSLIQPFNYNPAKPSSGCDISEPLFLNHLRRRYPEDLQKIFIQFPHTEAILFRYDTYEKPEAERAGHH